ncbi:MAG: FAD-dependent oxidoreductase [Deltaproteobacteria bacterium]|jgi:2,4-dienoyl-CoA reductase-like NADH-dependent reductase (Old Yellow Enzyme family)|nr:FAD-dependent oxidoreductase [Deltaproteobacteria bacterium]
MSFEHLFTPHRIRGLEIRNRIFSSSHQTILARDWCPTEEMAAYHEARAAGGAGLIVMEAACTWGEGDFESSYIDASRDACIPGFRKCADAAHRHGCKMFGQISNGGRLAGGYEGLRAVPNSPSTVPDHRFYAMPRAMPTEDVWKLIEAYADSARRMMEAGLDGIELAASHGLQLAQFLSPDVNRRDDEFGGSEEKRFRFVREVVVAVRKAIGPDPVIGIRISADEDEPSGLDAETVLAACRRMDALDDVDFLSIVLGSMAELGSSAHVVPPMSFEHCYTAPHAAAIKGVFSRSILVTGRINQPQMAEQILAEGQADMCGMTRAMICDPQMPNKARLGKLDDIRACVGCNQTCIGHYHQGVPISCFQNPLSGRELRLGEHPKAATPRNILVAGGGPGGMKAAAVAAERGHRVVLCEKSRRLGGQVLLAQTLPGREEFGGCVDNLKREMELAGVEVRLNTSVDTALIDEEKPDAIIIATGATPFACDAVIADDTHAVEAWQVLRGEVEIGNSVVIADWRGDWIGMGLAEKLARDGCRVRLAVSGIHAGQNLQMYIRDTGVARLHRLGVEIIPYARLYGADGDTAYFHHMAGSDPIVCEGMDTLVLSQGHQPEIALEQSLRGSDLEIHLVGDCLSPRSAEEAVYEGLMAARKV